MSSAVMNAGLILSGHLKQVGEAFSIISNSILILVLLKGNLTELSILYKLVSNKTVLTSTNGLVLLYTHHRVILLTLETFNFS